MVQDKAQRETRVVVLAAGRGTRMKSERAKVLHEVCGRSMLGHAQRLASEVDEHRPVVVVGADAQAVREACPENEVEFVVQAEQRGTGHAVMVTQEALAGFAGDVLILYGDTPLLRASTVLRMRALKQETQADLVVLTAEGSMPGRIVRTATGQVERIVEAQDASSEELAIEERNTGVYLVDAALLWPALESLRTDNKQGELYLTDVVAYAVKGGHRVEGLLIDDPEEGLGINTRSELADANRIMRRRIGERL
ncbi:MAG: NTP transferase domain-containing protein, partial [Myxococcota bacterium]|nr:NTP transferase domain-containing protein [Myxococcota bacterium]